MLNTRDEIVTWFCQTYPEVVSFMKSTNHFSEGRDNHPFHGEGSVWTHTLMVMTHLHCDKELIPEYKKILLTVAMLHDIGKPSARQTKYDPKIGTKYSFEGHEGLSTIIAIDILNSMEKEDNFYTNKRRLLILELISLHGTSTIYDEDSPKYLLQSRFREADKGGAIRNVDENIFKQYPKRKVSNRKQVQDDKILIMMIGLPGAGKTSYINQHFDESYFIISRDDYMEKFYFENNDDEKLTHNDIYDWINSNQIRLHMFNQAFDQYLNQMAKNKNKIILDMTMLTAGKRRNILNRFSKFRAYGVCLLKGELSLYIINNKRESLGRSLDAYRWITLKKKFLMPTIEEGFDGLNIILFDDEKFEESKYVKHRRRKVETESDNWSGN